MPLKIPIWHEANSGKWKKSPSSVSRRFCPVLWFGRSPLARTAPVRPCQVSGDITHVTGVECGYIGWSRNGGMTPDGLFHGNTIQKKGWWLGLALFQETSPISGNLHMLLHQFLTGTALPSRESWFRGGDSGWCDRLLHSLAIDPLRTVERSRNQQL